MLKAPRARSCRLPSPAPEVARLNDAVQLLFAPVGLVFCWIHAQRQPWLRIDYTAGAGCGILMRARRSERAAGETESVSWTRERR
jgi:hypothetical protein